MGAVAQLPSTCYRGSVHVHPMPRASTRPREVETSRSTGGVFSGCQPARPPTGFGSCLSRDLTRKTRSPRNEPLSHFRTRSTRVRPSAPPYDTGNSKDKSRRWNRTHPADSQIDGRTRPFAPDLGLPVCVPFLRCSPGLFPFHASRPGAPPSRPPAFTSRPHQPLQLRTGGPAGQALPSGRGGHPCHK